MTESQKPDLDEIPSPYDPEIIETARGILNDPNHEAWLQIEADAIAVDQSCKDVAEHARHIS